MNNLGERKPVNTLQSCFLNLMDRLTRYLLLLLRLPVGFAVVDRGVPALLDTQRLVEGRIDQNAAGFERG